jgi:hypothetical protein
MTYSLSTIIFFSRTAAQSPEKQTTIPCFVTVLVQLTRYIKIFNLFVFILKCFVRWNIRIFQNCAYIEL